MNDYSNLFKNDNILNKENLEELYKTKILEIETPNKNNRIFSEELFLDEKQIKKRKNVTANNILKTKKERKIRSTAYYRNFKNKK